MLLSSMNPYSENFDVIDLGNSTSIEEVSKQIPSSRLVKAFNTMYYEHLHTKPGNSQQVFSRDCLEVDVQLRNGETLTIYINHLKSQIGGGNEKRLQQTTRMRE
jgi:hypothetical protein